MTTKSLSERILNPHVFAPYGEPKGMVSENVRDEDFAPDPCFACEGTGTLKREPFAGNEKPLLAQCFRFGDACHYCGGTGKGGHL